jgi:hypothetical protein
MAREHQSMSALWQTRLARKAARPAAVDGDAAVLRLLTSSGGLHGALVLVLGLSAYLGASPAGLALAPGGFALPLALAGLGLAAALLLAPYATAFLGLTILAGNLGFALGVLGQGTFGGAGVTFAVAVVVAEGAALLLHLGRRASLAAPVSLAAAALCTGALAYLLEGGELAGTPLGTGLGGALALAFVTHARYAEGALAWRHGSAEVAAAALTRWVEGPRVILLALPGFFFPDDDLPGSPST